MSRPKTDPIGPEAVAGLVTDWLRPCAQLLPVMANQSRIRRIIEAEFVPLEVWDAGNTVEVAGVAELVVPGSRRKSSQYPVPIYSKPPDLVAVRPADLDPSLPAVQLFGKLAAGRLGPYFTRSEIWKGALKGQALELAWVADVVTAWELELNRGGLIRLSEGGEMRVVGAGTNGREVVNVRTLVFPPQAASRKPLRKDTSLQAAIAWLKAHPAEATRIIAQNHRLTFFREVAGGSPVATSGYGLVPGRSMLVDGRSLPVGVPFWLDLEDQDGADIRRLVFSHDTGGQAFGGAKAELFVRADAEGNVLQASGRMWMFLPKAAVKRLPIAQDVVPSVRKTAGGG